MPLTSLDTHAALIVVDLQNGGAAIPRVPRSHLEVVEHSNRLAEAFRALDLPVVLVRVVGRPPGRTDATRNAAPRGVRSPDQLELVPELIRRSSDVLIDKSTLGAFSGTTLAAALADRGVTQVMITGCATSIGVEATAFEAFSAGLNAVVVVDAVADSTLGAHDYSVGRVLPRLAELATTDEVIELLAGRG